MKEYEFELFVLFLEKKGVKDKFEDRLKKDFGIQLKTMCDVSQYGPEDYILTSIAWCNSPEGYEFWEDLHYDWRWTLRIERLRRKWKSIVRLFNKLKF